MTFKDSFRDFQELVREHKILRDHNKDFKEGDPQAKLLLFSEAALILILLERFLRILPDVEANNDDTLFNLLEKATSKSRQVLDFGEIDKQDAIMQITNVRNTILHGNFEQAAKQAGSADKEAYFKTQFASEIEGLYKITDALVAQIDPETGKPCSKRITQK